MKEERRMYKSLEEISSLAANNKKEFWEIILEDDEKERQLSKDQSMNQMEEMYRAMKDADASYDPARFSASGLVGTDGEKLRKAREEGKTVSGDFIGTVMEKAVKMGESNACMKRIVAAPTAGSCGVVPAVLLTMQEKFSIPDEKMVKALYTAAGIGGVIANRAFIAGASGGCQAEIGSASAMAAGAVAYLQGGDENVICHAAALALKSLLGLVCDPVAGLVEVPCVKRNVIGAVNALTSADMALAGIESRIPPDEVIDAMKSIGISMAESLKETGTGGLAATPTGTAIREQLVN